MSNSAQGVVLAGQPVAVRAGAGITIDTNGIISVDASSVTGLVKLNNPAAFNAYVFPNVDGTTGQFLQTDGTGNLTWATAQGYAVVTVQSGAPSPADIGELWFDCATGTLNVYQNCVGTPSPNWFNVAQPGLPVLPANTSAAPSFVSGSGTSAAPYVCNATAVPVSGSAFIVNTVSVSDLAPYQYVPIADLAGVANGGRFSFSNYYADATGTLTFNTIFNDVPGSSVGTVYTANIKIGYGSAFVDADVTIVAALTLTPGTITGTPTVGTAVAYTPGVASGGTSPYTYTYQWFRDGVAIGGETSSSYTPVAADVGKTLSVTQTVTDSALATASATTTASGVTVYASIPSGTWNPGNTMNTSVPGTSSGTWNGATGTVTSSGCVVLSTTSATGPWSQSVTATNGQPLYVQWDMSAAGTCGDAATGTTITGDVTSAVGQNSYSVTINRIPNPAIPDITDTNVALSATVSAGIAATISGLNATAYVTAGAGSTGSSIGVSLTAGGPFTAIPAAGSTSFPITNGQTLYVQQTVGGTINTAPGYTAVVKVGDADGVNADEFTYFAQTVSAAAFPDVTFSPVGGPNAAPETVTGVAGGGTLGTLEGFAPSNAWPAAYATTLSSPVSGANPTMKMRVGAASYATSGVAVASGNVVDIAWNQAYLDTVADGSAANGSITGTVGATTYTNTFTMTVKRSAAWTVTPDPTGAATSTQQTTGAMAVNNFNVPVTVSFAAPGGTASPMTAGTISAVVGGGASVPITLGTTTVTLNPGQTLEVIGDTGGSNSTEYGVAITIGTSATQEWLVTTTAVTDAITAPTMAPTGGPLNPATNSPAGITLSGGTYTPASGSPGAHASTDWELYSGSYPLTSTNSITSVAQNTGGWTLNAFAGGSAQFTDVYGVSYANGRFVAAGGTAAISTSTDGITWSLLSPSVLSWGSSICYAVGYGNGRWIIGGQSGKVSTSTDGSAWSTTVTVSNWSTSSIKSVAYGNGRWIVAGETSYISASTDDGVSWSTAATLPGWGFQTIFSVKYANNLWVAVGQNGKYATSIDGTTWANAATITDGSSTNLNGVAYGDGLWVAVGAGGSYSTSTDGTTWTSMATMPGWTSNDALAVAYANGLWVAVGQNGCYSTSIDGTTWTTAATTTPSTGVTLNSVAYGDGLWVLVASSGRYVTSSSPSNSTTLTIAGCQTDGFQVGDTVESVPAGVGPAIISAVSNTAVTVIPDSTSWTTQKITRATSMYAQVVPPPANPNSSDLESLLVPEASLTVSSTYYSRARYSSATTTSPWANWASFSTSSSFVIAPGTPMGGGYFAGQMYSGGTAIYNLIVAPIRGTTSGPDPAGTLLGQYSTNGGTSPGILQWSVLTGTASSSSANDTTNGKPWTDLAATSPAGLSYPPFDWCINSSTGPNGSGGIGGFTDWYIPAYYELAILYFFLKPTTAANDTSSGSNPISGGSYTANTNYGPGFPSQTSADGTGGLPNFQSGGSEEFSTSYYYWSSTQTSSTDAKAQLFSSGENQLGNNKTNSAYVRAIRRISA